jgi:putative DNA primase/helicase
MRSEKIGDLCVGRWESILTSLGIAPEFLSKKHGPCPLCGGKDRWRFDNKDGRGTWFCSNDGAGDGFALIQKLNGWSFVQAAREVERVLGVSKQDGPRQEFSDEQKRAALKRAWTESKPVTQGDPVWAYLNRRTGIETVSSAIRYHPNLRYDATHSFPAMLATVTMPDGKASTMHRTWLDGNGGKAPVGEPKKVMAGTIKTGAIRLTEVYECLGIAEGIETALRASVRFDVPTWAAISAGGMRDWEVPEGVKHVIVFGDNDANYTGQSAAFALANRLALSGLTTEIFIPEKVGTDWADE